MNTVPCRWTFGGVTYEVDAPEADIEGEGDGLVRGDDVERAEHAAVYAAMCDGIDDPETLSFARRSIGLGKAAMAARFGMSAEAFMEMESNREVDGRASYVCLLRMMVKLSDRGTFAVRRVG